jgi:hypothetical protein
MDPMKPPILLIISTFAIIIISCSLFTQSVNPGDVKAVVSATLTAGPALQPEPTALPTTSPTQLPPENRRPSELRVAFIGPDRNLYAWSKSTGVVKLMDSGDVSDLKISEDGTLIAFTRQTENQQSSLWMIGFDGSNPREVMNWNDLAGLKTNGESLGTSPANLQWIPGTHTLTFTSHEVFEGPGFALNDDLIVINGDRGAWNILLKAGQGGKASFSPGGKWMALSTAKNISIMDVNGIPAPGPGLDFTPVMTYSEYQYYPVPVWAEDGSRLAVFIPTTDPLAEPRQPGTVWALDVQDGNPKLQAQVSTQFIGPVTISPDLGKFFYVKEVGLPADNRREIHTAQINGEGEFSVYTGGIPLVWDWNPNSEVFAYQSSQDQPVTVSQMNGSIGFLADTNGTEWFSWVDDTQFLFARTSGDNNELYLGKWKEGSQLIAALPKSDMFRIQVDFAR